MANRNPRTISPTKANRLNELFKLIESGNSELLQDELNMHKLRQTFSTGRDGANISTSGGSPRRSQKYTVDDSGMQRNARLSQQPHPDNTSMPDLITGSLDQLFDGNRSPTKFRL